MDSSWFQPLDSPSVVVTDGMLTAFVGNVLYSLRSIGSTGLLILGVCLSALIVVKFFSRDFFYREKVLSKLPQREFSRDVYAADVEINERSVLNDGLLRRVVGLAIDMEWRKKHREDDIAGAIYRKEVNLEANKRFMTENIDSLVEEREMKNAISKIASYNYRDAASSYYRRGK